MGFRLAPQARADLDEIWDYVFIESGSEAIADRLLDDIHARFEFLGDWPRAGRQRDVLRAGFRSHTVGNYVIFYRVEREDVVIQRVLHGRRDLDSLFRSR
jgi:toxin ParE1/3/4